MSLHKKHCKRILKQYGNHIKAFEDRSLEPSKEIEEFRKKYSKSKICRYTKKTIKGLNLYDNNPLMSILHTRYGFASRKKNKISSYSDIEKIANE